MQQPVSIAVELHPDQAWAIAQLLKRIGVTHCRSLAEDDEQADQMMQAIERLRDALAQAGYAPR